MKKKNFILTLFAAFLAINTGTFAQSARGSRAQIFIKFDNRPDEVSYQLRSINDAGEIVRVLDSNGGFSRSNANRFVRIPLGGGRIGGDSDLQLVIRDAGGNGISNGAIAINTGVQFEATSTPERALGWRILNVDGDFGAETVINFNFSERPEPEFIPNDLSIFSPLVPSGRRVAPTPPSTPVTRPTTRPRVPAQVLGISRFTYTSTGSNSVDFLFENTSNTAIRARLTVVDITTGRSVVSRQTISIAPGSSNRSFVGIDGNLYVARLNIIGSRNQFRSLRFGL